MDQIPAKADHEGVARYFRIAFWCILVIAIVPAVLSLSNYAVWVIELGGGVLEGAATLSLVIAYFAGIGFACALWLCTKKASTLALSAEWTRTARGAHLRACICFLLFIFGLDLYPIGFLFFFKFARLCEVAGTVVGSPILCQGARKAHKNLVFLAVQLVGLAAIIIWWVIPSQDTTLKSVMIPILAAMLIPYYVFSHVYLLATLRLASKVMAGGSMSQCEGKA